MTFNASDDLKVIEATGKAFGEFQTRLSDFDGSALYETIPDFHNTKKCDIINEVMYNQERRREQCIDPK